MKLWADCTPAEQEQRRINFGDCNRDKKAESDAWSAELVRLFQSGALLSRVDRREARRLIRESLS